MDLFRRLNLSIYLLFLLFPEEHGLAVFLVFFGSWVLFAALLDSSLDYAGLAWDRDNSIAEEQFVIDSCLSPWSQLLSNLVFVILRT